MSYRSNKDGRAARPTAKRVRRPRQSLPARMFKTVQAGPLLAPKVMSKLRYAAVVTHSSGVADAGMYQFRLNSPYDPDYTGAGSQPPYFDRMSALYSSFRVIAAKYRVRAVPASGVAQVIAVWTAAVATAVATKEAAISQTDARTITASSYADPDQNAIKRYIPIAKGFGVERAEIETDSDYSGSASANPTKQLYLNLYAGNLYSTTTSVAYSLVEITYYTEWSNPIVDNMN